MTRIVEIAAATALGLLLAAGCSEELPETTALTTVFAITAPEGDGGAASVRDEHGIFDLQAFPAFVSISVTAPDMDPIAAAWPESAEEFAVGEQTVELSLDVPPGSERQVHLTLFMFQQDRPHCYMEEEPYFIDLTPGTAPTLEVKPGYTGIGTVSGTTTVDASQVWLIDLETMVRLDRTMVEKQNFEFENVCAHRQLALAWLDNDGVFHFDSTDPFSLLPDEKMSVNSLLD